MLGNLCRPLCGRLSAHDVTPAAHAPTGRRRRAAWLLVGWLAFWLTTAAQPFEHGFTGEPDHRSAVSSPMSGGYVSHAEHTPDPAPDDEHCPDLSAVTVDATFAETAKGGPFDTVYPSSRFPVPVTQLDGKMRILKAYYPPPSAPTPLYLRTQRLLI